MPTGYTYRYCRDGREQETPKLLLGSALFGAVVDLHQGRAEPLAICRGATVLYDAMDLHALWKEHAAALSAGEYPAVAFALYGVADATAAGG